MRRLCRQQRRSSEFACEVALPVGLYFFYWPGKLIQNETKTLTKEQTDRLLAIMDENTFWKLPSIDKQTTGHDGARWVIEGMRGRNYHLVDRWSPRDGEVRAIGLSLLKEFSQLKIITSEIY